MAASILCVDDDDSWRRILARYFKMITTDLEIVENRVLALEKIRQKNYNLLVLDGLEGGCFELVSDISAFPHGKVVILSGDARIEETAKNRGICFYHKSAGIKSLDEIAAEYISK